MGRYKEKICPGCGEAARFPAGGICSSCKRKIADYDRMKAAFNEFNKRYLTCTYGFYDLPPINRSSPVDCNGKQVIRFQNSLYNLIDALSPIQPGEQAIAIFSDTPHGYQVNRTFEARCSFQGRYVEFTDALKWLLSEAFEHGKARGKHLLHMLQNGEISTYDFDSR